jgi:DNA (cytosine-5)-methyltransferase 1
MEIIRFTDLFCGVGGFRVAMERVSKEYNLKSECVLSSDIDSFCRLSYEANFGEYPDGDITEIDEKNIPDHDILFAGFPCQPFSIIGQMRGFEDTRGTLFFDIARILKEKKTNSLCTGECKAACWSQWGQNAENHS